MNIQNPPDPLQINGFILPITLGLISLVGLWGTILIEHMQIQSAQIEKSWQEKLIFHQAQEHLQRCIAQHALTLTLPKIVDQCCLMEELATSKKKKSSNAAVQKLYRFSVHHQLVHPRHHQVLGATRLQAHMIKAPISQTHITWSWREIFDLPWEKELSKQSAETPYIWDQLPICQHVLPTH
jgi:hypothetical protein